ncbi:MAG: hybrid sensor histidine kinase/response regulator [Chloroflexi bacterium]|nr:hybrid sensor histidine kinase/response regulator [Chloroflexota bacterium]
MNRTIHPPQLSFRADLRIPTEAIIATLFGCAVALGFASEFSVAPTGVAILAIAVMGTCWVLWELERSHPAVAQWGLVLVTAVALATAAALFRAPVILSLLVVPTGLAAALIGIQAATVTAIIIAACLPAARAMLLGGIDSTAITVVLIGIFATLGLFHAVLRQVAQLERWLEEYFERSQNLVEETRDRRAELGKAMDDVMHLNRQLVLVNERVASLRLIAEEARRAKAAFVARVSHELRTPLNMIIGLVRLMVDSPGIYSAPLPPDLSKDLQVIHRNSEHLLSLINDVLDLSQVEAGRGKLYRERVNIYELISAAADAVRPLIDNKRLYLRMDAPADLPAVDCDRTRIRQVVLNLLSNAARFTEQGGISISAKQQDAHVVVNVRDTGPGIAPDVAEHLFEPFYQAGELWIEKGGSGLGLSICKQFVRLHGGRIWLDSELGAGTSVSFELPISPPPSVSPSPAGFIREDWIWREHTFRTDEVGLQDEAVHQRLIVCDAGGDLTQELTRVVEDLQIVGTASPEEAIKHAVEVPALAILHNATDPGTVWSQLDHIRQAAPATPIVGACFPPQLERALEAGSSDYLVKPVTREDLEQVLTITDGPTRRILVVDDNPDVLQLIGRMLHTIDAGLDILTAANGPDAIATIRHRRPDLVLLDLIMPGMDGWQVLAEKSRDPAIRDIPIVLVSAQDPAEHPPASRAFWATIGDGISLQRFVECTLAFANIVTGAPGISDSAHDPLWAQSPVHQSNP